MSIYKLIFCVFLSFFLIFFQISYASPKFNNFNIDDLKNLTYTIYPSSDKPMKVKLSNGKYSRRDSPLDFVMTSINKTAIGDLNHDGKPDAAVILFSNYGGSGDFAELAAVAGVRTAVALFLERGLI